MRGEMVLDTRTACGEFVLPQYDQIPAIAFRTAQQRATWRGAITPPVYAALHGVSLATARLELSGERKTKKSIPPQVVGETSERGRPKSRTEVSKHDLATVKIVLEAVRDSTKVAPWQMLEKHRASEYIIRARMMAFGIIHERLCTRSSPLLVHVVAGLLNERTSDALRKTLHEHRANLNVSGYAVEFAQVKAEVDRRLAQ